jgi:hypothetical protein
MVLLLGLLDGNGIVFPAQGAMLIFGSNEQDIFLLCLEALLYIIQDPCHN